MHRTNFLPYFSHGEKEMVIFEANVREFAHNLCNTGLLIYIPMNDSVDYWDTLFYNMSSRVSWGGLKRPCFV